MKHTVPKRRSVYEMRDWSLEAGWQSLETLPDYGAGDFMVLTFSGLVRRAHLTRANPRIRPADGYGPARVVVAGVQSGNYLAAIAWRWPDDHEVKPFPGAENG